MSVSDIISLLSGVALFLFGMSLMGDGLKRVSGNKLEPILFKLSSTPLKGVLLGTGVTAVIQSSSATSVMMVGFVNSGMMKVRQAMYVILGAILGTSVTGWVICLSYINGTSGLSSILSTATLTGVVAVAGIILRMFSKKQMHHYVGDIMMGFAVLMFGMSMMSGSVSGLGQEPWFTSLLTGLNNPILGILVGVLFCAILQSASAAVGIVQALSVTGAILFSNALPFLMGISIGGALPVLLSALGAKTEGRRTAFSYMFMTIFGVIVCALLYYILDAVFVFSFRGNVMNPFSIALVNTIFRLILVIVVIPFMGLLEKLVNAVVKGKKQGKNKVLELEDRFIAYPALALEQTHSAICDMAEKAGESVEKASGLIQNYNQEIVEQVNELEGIGDMYEDELGAYLMKLTAKELTDQQGRHASVYLHTLSDFERISDHAQNIAENATELHDKKLEFSGPAMKELSVIGAAVHEIIGITLDAFIHEDVEKAKMVEPLEEVVDDLSDEMKMRHVDRLQHGQCTIANGFVFNDLITNYERISDHCSNIALAIMEMRFSSFAGHEYIGNVKAKHLAYYEKVYQDFRKKYHLDEAEAAAPVQEKEPAKDPE